MRLIDRYILFEFLKNLVLSLLALMLLFFIGDYIHGAGDRTIPAMIILQYTSYQMPLIFTQMVPPAAMLSTLITLSLLNRKSELTAMFASGVSLIHIASLIFGAILMCCCISLMVTDRVTPPLAKKRIMFFWKEIKKRDDFTLDIRTTKIWYRSKNYIYNLRLFDKKTNMIQGLGIYFFNDKFNLMQHVEAESAKYVPSGEWELKNGMITVFPDAKSFPMSTHFKEKSIQLPQNANDFSEIEKQVDSLRIRDLWKFIVINKAAGIDTKTYEVDLHGRLAMTLVPLIMGLLAVPYSIRSKRQGSLVRDISICALWVFVYWIIYSISLSLGRSGGIVPWAAVWVPCILFLLIAVGLIVREKAR